MKEPAPNVQIFISKLTEIILDNLGNENFDVKELAQESGMSRYVLTRKLFAITNKTPNQFIREVRLKKALDILRNEVFTISEVAYKTGFSSPSYFISCFHEFFGYTPGEVKNKRFEGEEENILPTITSIQKQKRVKWRVFILTSAGILILAVIVYIIYDVDVKNSSTDSGIPIKYAEKSIAVLPIKNLSNIISDQYFYDGVMEEIFNNLSKVHDLRVISRTSVEQYRNTVKTAPVIGKELNVNYIIEGSGQKYGNKFRIRIQLIEVSTDKHIWAESFQHKMKSIRKFFRIQSQIAENIAAKLNLSITLDEKELIEKVPTYNMSAYNLYLKANSYSKDYENTRDSGSYKTAIDLYDAALELDTTFAKVYTGLAFAYWNRYYYETYFKENFLDSCLILAEKALSYDDQLDEAYYLKGQYSRVNGYSVEALNNYDKALEINPNYLSAYIRKWELLLFVFGDYVKGLENCYKMLNLFRGTERSILLKALARTYLDVGFTERAKDYYYEALVLDGKKASYLNNSSWIEFCLGNFEEALKLMKQAVELDSTNLGYSANFLGYYCVFSDRNEEAYNLAIRVLEMYKKAGALNLQRSHRVGYAFWQVGKKKEALDYFRQQIKYGEENIKLSRPPDQMKATHYDLAGTYAFLGDKAKAYQHLDELAKKNTFPLWWVTMIKYDLIFDNIRNEERFQKILQTIESKYLAEQERVRKWLEEQEML